MKTILKRPLKLLEPANQAVPARKAFDPAQLFPAVAQHGPQRRVAPDMPPCMMATTCLPKLKNKRHEGDI